MPGAFSTSSWRPTFPTRPVFHCGLAIGRGLLGFVETPLAGLQLASATASVLMVWPLVILGRRVAPPPVALAAALLVLLLPGPWLHAVRGFSSTPATAFLLAAAVVATSRPILGPGRATAFTLLMTASFLIRPILLPVLALLWVAGSSRAKGWRVLLPGVLAGTAAVAIAVAVMARAEGGWGKFFGAFATHARRHTGNLVRNTGGLGDLGLAVGCGPTALAVALVVLAVIGVVVWGRRRGVRESLVWVMLVSVMVTQLVLLQNRTYTRYAVPVQLAVAPLVAAGAAVVAPAWLAACGLGGLALVGAAYSFPLLVEQHADQLPGWRAVVLAEEMGRRHGVVVVDEAGLYPFTSYWWHARRHAGGTPPPRTLSPWAPEPWQGPDRSWLVVTDMPERHLDPPTVPRVRWNGVSDRLRPFTQQRFLSAEVLMGSPLNVGPWWPAEGIGDGRFMWGGPGAELWLPPAPEGRRYELDVRPAPGATLTVLVNGDTGAELTAGARTHWWVPTRLLQDGRPNVVQFARPTAFRPGGGDSRELAVQVFGVRQVGPFCHWHGSVATARSRRRLGVEVDGVYLPERLADGTEVVWLTPSATMTLPAGPGELVLTVAAPRPVPPRTELRVGERLLAGPLELNGSLRQVVVPIAASDVADGRVQLSIESVAYVPAADGHSDTRELGIMIAGVQFRPQTRRW